MTKRAILDVCTLSAHLATQRALRFTFSPDLESGLTHISSAAECAADAMALQRLGRSATNNATRLCNVPNYQERHDRQAGSIHAKAQAILKPYGLTCTVGGDPRGYNLFVIGLPGNTLGGDQDGFGI